MFKMKLRGLKLISKAKYFKRPLGRESIRNWIIAPIIFSFVFLCGCDAFVRKFTRKHRKEDLPKEEMVLAPEEYKAPVISKEEAYRQYFLYWQSWHDELLEAFSSGNSHKKYLSCIDEELKNLSSLRGLLKENKQKKLDIYIGRINNLRASLEKDVYANVISRYRSEAERIKRDILRDLSYNKIKDYLL